MVGELVVGREANLVGVIQVQQPALALVDVLVARVGASNNQSGVHVHVVAGEVERNQALEDDGPSRKGRRQENQQARGGAAVRDHVQDGAEASRLVKGSGSISIESVEQARDAVEQGARARVQGHIV